MHKRALDSQYVSSDTACSSCPIKYTLERSHVESHWTAIFQQGGSIITDKAYRLRSEARYNVHTREYTEDRLATARRTDMRNCFIGHCLCTQLLYHSFTEGGVSLTTNQFEAHLAPPRPRRPCEHRVPLSGQCFVSPGARRPAVPDTERHGHGFPFPRSVTGRFVTLGFVAKPRDNVARTSYSYSRVCWSHVWCSLCNIGESRGCLTMNQPYVAFCCNRENWGRFITNRSILFHRFSKLWAWKDRLCSFSINQWKYTRSLELRVFDNELTSFTLYFVATEKTEGVS